MSAGPSIVIDGREIPFAAGQTIMEAARAAGVYIPHLCYHPEFQPHGSCRVCTVEVDGRYLAACTSAAQDGQVVRSEHARVNAYRRTVLQMLFVEGNHVCPACERSGNCELQAIAYYTGMLAPHFTHFYPHRPVDASHPEVLIDFNRCILCELCVRASRDVDGKNVFAVRGRGIQSRLTVNAHSGELGDTSFAATDKAAQVCPVGAILIKHRGYEIPIGDRLYDRHPINEVDEASRSAAQSDGEDR